MNKKPKITDIAKKLNVSITSVSYIINGKAKEYRISAKLEKKVLDYVNSIQYIPNQVAQSLRTGKTNLIGLIVDDISNPFYASIARFIEERAVEKGFRLLYCSSENDLEKIKDLIKLFRERQVDAFIITPTPGSEELIEQLLIKGSKLVLFDRFFKTIDCNYVIIDNEQCTYNAITHLIDQNFKNIAFITLDSTQTQMEDRLKGYTKCIKKNKLTPYIKKIAFDTHSDKYINQIVDFLKSNKEIDALFFSSSVLGIAGLQAIKSLKKRIPDDLGVISFDDQLIFQLFAPTISAVAQPIEDISNKLIEIILDSLNETSRSTKSEIEKSVLKASLIIRNSSQRNSVLI